MKLIGAGVVLFGLLLAGAAGADAGVPTDAGPTPCASNDDCSQPTPYCHATRKVCVECVSNVNCFGVALVCNVDKGICANCASDSDCYNSAPYCSATLNSCVECKTDANCGNKGIKCKDGVCGSCGDGICSDNERKGLFGICKDCTLGCPKNNLGSKMGDPVTTGTASASDTYLTTCGFTFSGPGVTNYGATFAWTAPTTGSFLISGGAGGYVAVLADDCAGAAYTCWTDQAYISLNKGQKVAILFARVDNTAGPYSLSITDLSMTCNPNFCPAGPTGPGCCLNGDAGACGYLGPGGCVPPGTTPVDPIDVNNCITAAKTRGELTCMEGAYCRCNACPLPTQTCNNIDGCRQILSCMHRFKCSNMDCYTPDRCQATIDAYGGIGLAAFNYATQVVACDYMSGCNDCPGVPPIGDSGTFPGTGGFPGAGGSFSGTGARPTGSAGRPGAGTGGATSGFPDAGFVGPPKPAATSGGCDCGVARSGPSPAALSMLAGFVGLAFARRRRRS